MTCVMGRIRFCWCPLLKALCFKAKHTDRHTQQQAMLCTDRWQDGHGSRLMLNVHYTLVSLWRPPEGDTTTKHNSNMPKTTRRSPLPPSTEAHAEAWDHRVWSSAARNKAGCWPNLLWWQTNLLHCAETHMLWRLECGPCGSMQRHSAA